MKSRYLKALACVAILAVPSCSDAPLDPGPAIGPQLAKGGGGGSAGGGSTDQRLDFDFPAGSSITSDGLGTYRDGICGTVGVWSDIVAVAPFTSIPRSQRTACAGLPQRSATITLALLHGAAADHSDDRVVSAHPAGTYTVDQVKVGSLGGGVVNMQGPCNAIDRKGNYAGGTGLRLNPNSYPGTSGIISDDLGGGMWRFHTADFPDNLAYCEENGTVTYWHVDIDLTAQIVG